MLIPMQIPKHKVYTFTDHIIESMPETIEHRIIRSKSINTDLVKTEPSELDVTKIDSPESEKTTILLPEHFHIPGPMQVRQFQATILPEFLYGLSPKVNCSRRKL